MKRNDAELTDLLIARLREAAVLLKRFGTNVQREAKSHWAETNDPGFGGVVTRWDTFVQDFITGSIKAFSDNVSCFGEEEKCLFTDPNLDSAYAVIIDPIDGTEWFSRGEDDYSVLACIMKDGSVTWTAGVFPATQRMFIGNDEKVREIDFSLDNDHEADLRITINGSCRTLAAHYRFGRGEYKSGYDKLVSSGWTILMNGQGFGTNLTGAEKVLKGEACAFVAPKMSVVDGFPTASLIKSAGGVVKFFDPITDINVWRESAAWSSYDFGSDVGVRTRFIAAQDASTLDNLLVTLRS